MQSAVWSSASQLAPGPHQQPRPACLQHPHHRRMLRRRDLRQVHVQAGQSMIDALGGSTTIAPRAWWEDNKELWAEVHTEEQLDAELEGKGKELVVLGILV